MGGIRLKVISGFPCIGKTTLCHENKDRFMDLEFRETASTMGMNAEQRKRIFDAYGRIITEIFQENYYEYLFVTDNRLMLEELHKRKIPFTYIVPDISDNEFMEQYKERVYHRNDKDWYDRIIIPRLDNYYDIIDYVKSIPHANIQYLNTKQPYLADQINVD